MKSKKHLKLIAPHRRYFEFLQKETDIQVEFIEYLDVANTKKQVEALIKTHQVNNINTEANFKNILAWLALEKPNPSI